MPLILAVEPDSRQAGQLAAAIRHHVGAELILADTTEGALNAIGRRVPDLVLVPALLAPQEDAVLASALRVIAAAAHVRTLTIPALDNGATRKKPRTGMLARLGIGRDTGQPATGCLPSVFAEQIVAYLEEGAREREAARAFEEPAAIETAGGEAPIELDQGVDLSPELRRLCEDADERGGPAEEEVEIYSIEVAPEGFLAAPILGRDSGLPSEADPEAAEAVAVMAREASTGSPATDAIAKPEAAPEELLPDEDGVGSADEPGTTARAERIVWPLIRSGRLWPPMHVEIPDLPRVAAPVSPPPAAPADAVPAVGSPAILTRAPESEWVELIESLRLDIERLKAGGTKGPADIPAQAAAGRTIPAGKAKRPVPGKRQPVQDEWGFFDPEQCGFAALLAKLDEITGAADEPPARAH